MEKINVATKIPSLIFIQFSFLQMLFTCTKAFFMYIYNIYSVSINIPVNIIVLSTLYADIFISKKGQIRVYKA